LDENENQSLDTQNEIPAEDVELSEEEEKANEEVERMYSE
jgi:hypothetical protein